MAGVRLHAVRKVYDNGHVAVAGASFEVGDGELMVLVGPSGCGKSTLLRLVAGLEGITSGDLFIGEQRVNDLGPRERDVAMVFQSYALYPHMNVRQNLGFGLRLRGVPAAQRDAQVLEAARMLELGGVLDRRPAQLSGGQRQRVALGRALVRKPRVFLLDEPLSNLDAKLRLGMRAELARLHRQLQATMLYVTHDQIEAMTLGQRIVVFNAGEIQQIDTPARIYDQPANTFVAGFLGSPAMNLFQGRLTPGNPPTLQCGADTLQLASAIALPAALVAAQQDIIVGLRPEDLRPVGAATDPGRPSFAATVESIENVGNELFLTVRFGGEARVCRMPPQALPEPGQVVRLSYDPARLRFFDAASGQRLAV